MSFFDDLIAKVSTEDRAVLDKYPDLKSSVERMEQDLGKATHYASQWNDWAKQNWDPQAGMTKGEKTLMEQLQEAQTRLTAGELSGVDGDALKKLQDDFEKKLAEVQSRSFQAIEGMNMFYRAASTKMLPHQQEFGENFDPQNLMKFMQDNKIQDPDAAYDRMVAGRRAEIAASKAKELEAKHAADIQAAEQRGRELAAKEAAMGPGGLLPTDSTGGIAGVTAPIGKPAQVSDEMKAKLADTKLGDGSLAALGYEMLRRGELPVQ